MYRRRQGGGGGGEDEQGQPQSGGESQVSGNWYPLESGSDCMRVFSLDTGVAAVDHSRRGKDRKVQM